MLASNGRSTHKFEALDGLRGILALAVALHHFPIYSHAFLSPTIRTAGIAVDFFFVLSGFVITHASLPDLTTWRAALVFAVRRFGRLWPLHATMLIALILLELVKLGFTNETGMAGKFAAFAPASAKSLASIPTNFLLLQSMGIDDKWTWNGPSWSISTEFYTYLLFAMIAILTGRFVTAAVGTVALVCGAFFAVMGPDVDTSYRYGFFRCVCGFFIGHIVYRMWKHFRCSHLAGAPILELFSVCLIIAIPWMPVFDHYSILTPLLFALPIWIFSHQQGFVSAGLKSPLVQWLGVVSYSIYLDHQLVIDIIKRMLFVIERTTHSQISSSTSIDGVVADFFKVSNLWVGDVITLGFVCAVLSLAALTYRFVENPARRYFNRVAAKIDDTRSTRSIQITS